MRILPLKVNRQVYGYLALIHTRKGLLTFYDCNRMRLIRQTLKIIPVM